VPQASLALLDFLLAVLPLLDSTLLLDDKKLYASSNFCDTHARNLVQYDVPENGEKIFAAVREWENWNISLGTTVMIKGGVW
jgi:hypothetical protein